MKILFVSPFPPARDGIGDYASIFATTLLSQGHEVQVVIPRLMVDAPATVIGAISQPRHERARLGEMLKTWNPDIIHVQFAVAAFGSSSLLLVRWLRWLRRELGVPVVVTMHEVTRDTASLRLVGRAIYRRVGSCCNKVIVHTQAAFDVLTSSVGVPSRMVNIVPHPSPPQLAAESSDRKKELRVRFGLGDTRILLAFGFIHVDKGLNDLVRALRILKCSYGEPIDDLRLVVAGAVRPRNRLFRIFEVRDRLHLLSVLHQARRHGLGQHVVLTGYVPDRDVVGWLHAAEAVVLPYRRTEQSGVASLAKSVGVPVLASTAGGLGEQFAGSRWTFPPRNPERLAEVLSDFLSALPDKRVTVSCERLPVDLSSIMEKTTDIYLSMTQDPNGLTYVK
jgi:glycosyltransferase involved in cell wall biosynthesis